MKNLLLLILLFPAVVFAATKVPDDVKLQDQCPVEGRDVRQNIWKFKQFDRLTTSLTSKQTAAGKSVAVGDVIFYAVISTDAKRTYFEPSTDVYTVEKGFVGDRVTPFPKGTKLFKYGTLTSNDGATKYNLLVLESGASTAFLAALKVDGFLCSGQFNYFEDTRKMDFQELEIYENGSFVESEKSTPYSLDTIAVSLVSMDSIFATLSVKQLKAGKVVQQKEIQLDMMSGRFNVASLGINFTKADKSSIKINSIDEPKDYAVWLNNLKLNIFNKSN